MRLRVSLSLFGGMLPLLLPAFAQPAPARIDFARDIQPLLAQRCYDCHGLEKNKGGLRLTSLETALAGGESGEPALVRGVSGKSQLIQRVTTDDENDVMPQKGERLTAAEIELLKRWIDEGATWPAAVKHWAYAKPMRPPVPDERQPGATIRNPIDNFILARLEREGLSPSPEVDKPRWLRRVSLDLIGLPPTPQEVETFVADTSATAHERVVDRLLASPHYGERWARPWLDLARYADSHGFQRDDLRELWPYRDWVIRALNADMPFGQFTIWQIAGDQAAAGQTSEVRRQMSEAKNEKPEASGQKPGGGSKTSDVRRQTSEAGSQNARQTRNAKSETLNPRPRGQKPEAGGQTLVTGSGNPKPKTQNSKPRTESVAKARNLDALIATGFHRAAPTNVEAGTDQEEGRVNQVFDRVNTTAAVWLGSTLECAQCHNHKYDPFSQKEYYQLFAFFNNTARETDFTTPKAMASLKFTGPYIELPDPAKDAQRAALRDRMRELDEKIATVSTEKLSGLEVWADSIKATLASAPQTHPLDVADFDSSGGSVSKILPDKSVLLVDEAPDRDTYTITVHTRLTGITGFKLEALADPSLPGNGPGRGDAERPNFVLNNFRVTAARVGGTAKPVKLIRATASYSQSKFSVENLLNPDNDNRGGWAIGAQFHRDHWAAFHTEKPLGDAAGTTLTFTLVHNFGAGRAIGRLRLSALTGAAAADPIPADVAAVLQKPATERTAAQRTKVAVYFLAQDKSVSALKQAKAKATQELAAIKGPQTLVMRELEQPRSAAVLKRGSFLEPGEPVQPATPAVLHPLKREATRKPSGSADDPTRFSRLDLARWLVDRDNPLVARVTVNRWWAEFFGRGIVSTLEDFGIKGEPPTHPELLDWLAVEFMDGGWSMKRIHKLIALSATYRQSSRLTPELLARDDQNKLYARGPRFRLDAETIRDNALAVSGLLSLKQGGPPVRPYQPPGLWENKVGGDRVTYEVSTGEDAWRRGIYTVWKRSSPYPSFMNFDATSRTACTVKRSRSNTPLQALTLLNDPVYVQAAAALARRVVTERPDATGENRLRHAFQLVLARQPNPNELATLARLLEDLGAAYAADPKAARAAIGKAAVPTNLTASELAAWQAVASALLNLDETITKG
ncbi:MAG: PSD1 and planctomycete cytochrome C domain-containing protein [Opitutaceae bacterium]|nr:PSD1 and planctomycete cytochrome C domain-containing protein [Opitutaceae bacterium]